MKSFLKPILVGLALVACVLSANVFAQGIDPEQRITQMISSLEITSEQEPKFREVMNAYYAEIQSVMQSGDRGKIRDVMASQETKLAAVLTEPQMAKYREQAAARRARMGQ